jgi:CYTH domain-containing protein
MPAKQHSDLKLHLHHVPVEIERKFLITNDAWKDSVVSKVTIRDGLIAAYKDRKVRVRISDQIATITIKGPRHGIERWFRNFAQGDKWKFCLTTGTLVPANQERS